MQKTFGIDAAEASLARALARRLGPSTRRRSGRPARETVLLSTDRPAAEIVGAIRAAMRETGVADTTVWAGSNRVEVTAPADATVTSGRVRLLNAVAGCRPKAGHLPGVPFS